MGRTCNTYGREEECVQGFGGKARKKMRPLGEPRRRRVKNFKIDLREM
jgi:hypothetical protein